MKVRFSDRTHEEVLARRHARNRNDYTGRKSNFKFTLAHDPNISLTIVSTSRRDATHRAAKLLDGCTYHVQESAHLGH